MNRYKVIKALGDGTYGTVSKAVNRASGEIVAISGLKFAATGDTLCEPGSELALEGMEFPQPVLRVTVEPREPGGAEALLQALGKIVESA